MFLKMFHFRLIQIGNLDLLEDLKSGVESWRAHEDITCNIVFRKKRKWKDNNLDRSLFCTILRQLDLGQEQFDKKLESYSEGQKKKVLLATSLLTPAHLYIWDEPLNYIDIFSRMQLERLILKYEPTMLFVEHDRKFCEKIATKVVELY